LAGNGPSQGRRKAIRDYRTIQRKQFDSHFASWMIAYFSDGTGPNAYGNIDQ
jgi:hypothetical protein